MSNAVERIETSTVSVMDNDDLIDIQGIETCISILADHSYSSAGGAIIDNRNQNIHSKYPDSIIQNNAALRMIDQTKHFHSNWHNVSRTSHVVATWKLIEMRLKNPIFNNLRIMIDKLIVLYLRLSLICL